MYQDDADLIVLNDGSIVLAWEGYEHDIEENDVFIRMFESQMVGTNGRDKLSGTAADDIISGRGHSDLLLGQAGNDLIEGGNGRDVLLGGKGNDVLNGGKGNDLLNGGAGADQFVFGDGRDKIAKFVDDVDEIVPDAAALGISGLTANQIVTQFGSVSSNQVVLDFGGGDVLTIKGVNDLASLVDDISFL